MLSLVSSSRRLGMRGSALILALVLSSVAVPTAEAAGSITVLFPNGTETGTAALVSGVPYPVTWSSTGMVSNLLVIDRYDASGNIFVANIATNVPNTGVTNVLICSSNGNYRIRIWDSADPTISDFSDSFFSFVGSFHIVAPDGGEYWQIGNTRQVKWDSPANSVSFVDLWFTYDGDNWMSNTSAWTQIAFGVANTSVAHNAYNWLIPSNDWRLVSEKARMVVVPNGIPDPLIGWPGGANRDFSDNNFTNAGIVVMYPTLNAGIKSGNSVNITWAAAGVGSNAVISLFNGVTWSVLGTNACIAGTNNAFNAVLVGRTANALIKVVSGGLTGVSDPFRLADVNISAPVGGAEGVRSYWLIGTTNNIEWTTSGAGTNVAIKYITSEMGSTWTVITSNFPNNDSGIVTNILPWVVPGTPGIATVRVESCTQPDLYAEAGPFSMPGIKLTEPVGSVIWDFRGTNTLRWLSGDGASVVNVDISFNGGSTFESVTNAYSQDGSNYATIAFGAIRRPTDQARFRLTEDCQTNAAVKYVDVSAVDFGLRGIAMQSPSSGMTIDLNSTATNALRWFSALTVCGHVQLFYMPDGVSGSSFVITNGLNSDFGNVDAGSCSNAYDWVVDRHFKPSTQAVVRVVAGPYHADTKPFTMRGVVVTYPPLNAGIRSGSTVTITWSAAGAGTSAVLSLFNGVSWSILGSTVNADGTNNTFDAVLVGRTTNALIKVESGGVTGISDPFAIADMNISAPVGGPEGVRSYWLVGTTNNIKWSSSGAGATVTIKYITPEMGAAWAIITNNFPNDDSGTVTNILPWIVPGTPSGTATVRVESCAQPNIYADAGPFSLPGIKITEPVGNATWDFRGTNKLRWLSRDGASVVNVDISFNGGSTFESVTNAYSQDGSNYHTIAFGDIRRPTDQARFRLTQLDHNTNLGAFVDISADDFVLRGVTMSYPMNNMIINLDNTVTNALQWFSACTLEGMARLYYLPNGPSGPSNAILRADGLSYDFPNTDSGSCLNIADWVVDRSCKPSTQAVVRVVAGPYSADTKPFNMRGVRITSPAAGENVTIGSAKLVAWDFAGINGASWASNYVSLTGDAGPFAPHGFAGHSQIDFGGIPWPVDPDADPTTNAVIKMQIYAPTNDADVIILSQPFTLYGAKVLDPAPGASCLLGTSQALRFITAGMGPGAKASVYYSADGVSFDMANPVTNNFNIIDGTNAFTWNIENTSRLTRMPSTNAHLMIVSGSFTNISKAFTMNGVKITSPRAVDVLALSDGTNMIRWTSVGFPGGNDLSFTVCAGTNGTVVYPHTETIAAGVVGTQYPWGMTNTSVGKPVTITLVNGSFSTESAQFEITELPAIRITSPAIGDYFKVAGTNTIQWICGNEVSNDFRIVVTYADLTQQQLGSDGAFPVNAGVFSYVWQQIPDHPGPVRLIVTNLYNQGVWDVFTNFTIAPRFDVEPFTGDAYALNTLKFCFTPRGTVFSGVDLYYSTDPARATNSWTLINPGAPITVFNYTEASYTWQLPNVRTSTAWLRIQDHSYSQMFSADKPGPYDDYGTFPIKYYPVVWYVLDSVSMQNLNHLSVSEPFGSYSNITSPWTNYYPYGVWDSIWRQNIHFIKPVLAWQPQTTPTNVVLMTIDDADNDGMSDTWEMQYFGTLSRDGNGDFDGDGLIDRLEFEAGSDPTLPDTDRDGFNDLKEWIAGTGIRDNTSYFEIARCSTVTNEGTFCLEWDSVTGRVYSVYSATNLLSPSWVTNLYQSPGTGTRRVYTNNDSLYKKYFRLGVKLE